MSQISRRRSPFPALIHLGLALAILLGFGCSPRDSFEAEIRRTSYGIPHIEADTLAELGFGEGYAQAQDHMCTLSDVVVRSIGERAKYFGPGPENAHIHSDVTAKGLRLLEDATRELEAMDETTRGWTEGFVAGVNQYLETTGVDNVPGWCRGAEWVRPITAPELVAYQRSVTTILTNFDGMIATAAPPQEAAEEKVAAFRPSWEDFERRMDTDRASNGWGIGKDRSSTGGGMLVANPHYPWLGSNRFWEKHLRLRDGSPDGELDIYGVGLIGIPGVAIGFNRAVAWTHTVSAGKRYTAYLLTLNPDNPTQYRYGDEWRDLEMRTVNVEVAGDGGSESQEHSIWMSHYGPVVDFPGVGWTAENALAIRDANFENEESRRQWLAMDRAQSMDEFQQAHREWGGLPWVNTISTSADGRAWYIDSSSTPNLSDEALAAFLESTEQNPVVKSFWDRGIVLLDGSDPKFEWQPADGARDPGVVSYAQMPRTERTDYVFNANDSYWLNNSSALLTGYSPLMGGEGTVRTLRTRRNDVTLADTSAAGASGEDGKFDLDELAAASLSNISFAAQLLQDQLVERCRRQPVFQLGATRDTRVDLTEACDVLAAWDGRYDLDSRGAVLFREWITQYSIQDTLDAGDLFAVGWDPENPIETPNTLVRGSLAMERLAKAVQLLQGQGIALDAPLGEVQYAQRGDRRIPMHGGDGTLEGIENFVRNHRNSTTLEPEVDPRPMEGSRILTEQGYPVNSGTSFIMALQYQADGTPKAQAFLTYGQSGDPTNEHFWDQTELFSQKAWRPILFDEAAIEADTKSTTTIERTEAP